jgi:type II restriction/modification system DNA methylase subunit YeeA
LAPGRPNYVVLCNFDEFWIYDFDVQIDEPMDRVRIEELPERWGPLAFLFPTEERPVFAVNNEEVTRASADRLATLFSKLIARNIERETAQRFVLQCLIALFAEDIGLLDPFTFTRLLDECTTPSRTYDLIGGLFVEMNTPGKTPGGRFKGTEYFNGGIFEIPAHVELYPDELNQLKSAAAENWKNVRPEIFGTIFQHSVEAAERRAYGAHFTSAVDIMKIVKPTITDPWEQLISRAKTITELGGLHKRMQAYRVLDPACGSGNFLYLAYRELKRLEKKLFDRMDNVAGRVERQRRLSFVTARQFFGMDINPFAVELAKVTMMIARKLAIEELHMEEPALPFDDLNERYNRKLWTK